MIVTGVTHPVARARAAGEQVTFTIAYGGVPLEGLQYTTRRAMEFFIERINLDDMSRVLNALV